MLTWIAGQTGGWRPPIAFTAHPMIGMANERLTLGLPLIACLHSEELAQVVRHVQLLESPGDHPAVRRAGRLLEGRLGRGLVEERGWFRRRWVSHWLARRIIRRGADLDRAWADS